jgi:hypothetical protein
MLVRRPQSSEDYAGLVGSRHVLCHGGIGNQQEQRRC